MIPLIYIVSAGCVGFFIITLVILLFTYCEFICCCNRSKRVERKKNELLDKQNVVVAYTGNVRIDQLIHTMSDFNVDINDIHFGELLGKGSQGEVYLAELHGNNVAVKRVNMVGVDPATIEEFCQEATMMRKMNHHSLTSFIGISFQKDVLCILTEYVERGSLFDILQDLKSTYTWQRGLDVLLDVAKGMQYLHTRKPRILHRDQKSLNILVTRDWRGKVADFGMTRFHEEGVVMTQCGSPFWMAPEMIQNLTYDEKSDVYSFGICLWEIYTRQIPYRDTNQPASNVVVRVVRDGMRPLIPSSMPKPYLRLIERCWHSDPNRRPTFKQIVRVIESFQDESALLSHTPFDTTNPISLDSKHNNKTKKTDEDTHVNNQFKDGWYLEHPKTDIIQDSVTSNQRQMGLITSLKKRPSNNKARLTEADFDTFPQFGSTVGDYTRYTVSALTKELEHIIKPGAKPAVLSRHVGTSIPEQQLALLVYAEYPPDHHFAKLRNMSASVRVLFLTALAKDPAASKGDRIPAYAHQNINNSSMFQKSLRLQTDPSVTKRVKQFQRMVSNLRHPNIVLFMGGYIMPDYVGIITEQMHQGVLTPQIHVPHVIYDWSFCLSILLDIARGLQYLFTLPTPVVPDHFHPNMVLVDRTWRCKLSSVDLLPSMDEFVYGASPSAVKMPTAYTAPEFIEDFESKTKHTVEACIYSFAILINQLFARAEPYDGNVEPKVQRKVARKNLRPRVPTLCPSILTKLLHQCFDAEPSVRPGIDEVIRVQETMRDNGPPRNELQEGVSGTKLYEKIEPVVAFYSKDPVTIYKDWGVNEVKENNYIIYNGEDDVYCVEGGTFNKMYSPCEEGENKFKRLGNVLARSMQDAFVVKASNNSVAHGQAGDYLVQNSFGEQYVISSSQFQRMYRIVGSHTVPSTGVTQAAANYSDSSLQTLDHNDVVVGTLGYESNSDKKLVLPGSPQHARRDYMRMHHLQQPQPQAPLQIQIDLPSGLSNHSVSIGSARAPESTRGSHGRIELTPRNEIPRSNGGSTPSPRGMSPIEMQGSQQSARRLHANPQNEFRAASVQINRSDMNGERGSYEPVQMRRASADPSLLSARAGPRSLYLAQMQKPQGTQLVSPKGGQTGLYNAQQK